MKKLLPICIALLGLLCSCGKDLPNVDDVCTQMDDVEFMKYCYKNFDANGDGKVSMQEAQSVVEMKYGGNFHTVKGIEYFPNVAKINFTETHLGSLDFSKLKKLEYLRLYELWELKSVDVSGCPMLNYIYISGYSGEKLEISEIDLTGCASEIRLSVPGKVEVHSRPDQIITKIKV